LGKIDLHVHSSHSSDGELSPETIINRCAAQDVDTVSITDHNTVSGISEGKAAAARHGIQFIVGSEINCQTQNGTVLHMLAYDFDPAVPFFQKIEGWVNEREETANLERIELLEDLGIKLDKDRIREVKGERVLTCEMLAEVALGIAENSTHPLMKPFFPGGERSDQAHVNFFWDMCTTGKPADIPVTYLPVKEVVEEIQQAGGVAVLAHPGISIGLDLDLFDEIVAAGIIGVEVFSSYHSPEEVAFFMEQCRRYDLGVTAGSDFHGILKPLIELGSQSTPENEALIRDFLAKRIS